MVLFRRDALRLILGGALAAAASSVGLAARVKGKKIVTKVLPPRELEGTRASLASLAANITGYSVVSAGPSKFAVWLLSKDRTARLVSVNQREALPMFEVFSLAIATPEEIAERLENWEAPVVRDDIPKWVRTIITTRPTVPTPPTDFDSWPFTEWQTKVLQRAEFIVEDVQVGGPVGNNPNMQSAARPGDVPAEASASCEVAVGLLFSGSNGEQLLIGVDWQPENLVVTDEPSAIAHYLDPCEAIGLSAYLERLPNHS